MSMCDYEYTNPIKGSEEEQEKKDNTKQTRKYACDDDIHERSNYRRSNLVISGDHTKKTLCCKRKGTLTET